SPGEHAAAHGHSDRRGHCGDRRDGCCSDTEDRRGPLGHHGTQRHEGRREELADSLHSRDRHGQQPVTRIRCGRGRGEEQRLQPQQQLHQGQHGQSRRGPDGCPTNGGDLGGLLAGAVLLLLRIALIARTPGTQATLVSRLGNRGAPGDLGGSLDGAPARLDPQSLGSTDGGTRNGTDAAGGRARLGPGHRTGDTGPGVATRVTARTAGSVALHRLLGGTAGDLTGHTVHALAGLLGLARRVRCLTGLLGLTCSIGGTRGTFSTRSTSGLAAGATSTRRRRILALATLVARRTSVRCLVRSTTRILGRPVSARAILRRILTLVRTLVALGTTARRIRARTLTRGTGTTGTGTQLLGRMGPGRRLLGITPAPGGRGAPLRGGAARSRLRRLRTRRALLAGGASCPRPRGAGGSRARSPEAPHAL